MSQTLRFARASLLSRAPIDRTLMARSIDHSFCLKEIGWALSARKPVIVVFEEEERFFPFDINRWRQNQCAKGENGAWVEGWLSRKYEDCPENIKALVEEHANKMIPYRRR